MKVYLPLELQDFAGVVSLLVALFHNFYPDIVLKVFWIKLLTLMFDYQQRWLWN